MPNKYNHLKMIQGVIDRMGSNSFLLKGWSVILVSSLFVLSEVNSQFYFILLAYFPAIVFWFLDGYFLWQERLFRRLYNQVRKRKNKDVDYSMSVSEFFQDELYLSAVFSKTILLFHLTIIITIIVIMVIKLILLTS